MAELQTARQEQANRNMDISIENRLIIAYANGVESQHAAICNSLAKYKSSSFRSYSPDNTSIDCMEFEANNPKNNPYNALVIMQRLYCLNESLINEIRTIREQNLTEAVKQQMIDIRLAWLKINLDKQYAALLQEILETNNRSRVIRETEQAFKKRRLSKLVVVDIANGGHYYFSLTTTIGELAASLTRTLLILTRHVGHLSEAMPFVAGGLVLVSTLITMLTFRPNNLELHKSVNDIATILSGTLNITSYGLTVAKDFLPSIEGALAWTPCLGTVATLMMLCVEIGNIIHFEVQSRKDRELFRNYSEICGDDLDWLFAVNGLTDQQKRFKEGLYRYLSFNKFDTDDKELVESLFSKKNYETKIKPLLLSQAMQERDKRIARHCINAGILLVIASVGITTLLIPGIGQVLGLSVLGFIGVTLVGKLILFNTVLKEKKIVLNKAASEQESDPATRQRYNILAPLETNIEQIFAKLDPERLLSEPEQMQATKYQEQTEKLVLFKANLSHEPQAVAMRVADIAVRKDYY